MGAASHTGVYLWKSPSHAIIVALVWNPTAGRVSPQYHILFDNEFSTVPYMEACTIPPNWVNLVRYLSEMATTQYVDLEDTWVRGKSNEEALDPLSDPFDIVINNN